MYILAALLAILIFALVAISVAMKKEAGKAKRKLMVAKRAYELALAQLKKSPTSSDARQAALELGRNYSALTRDTKNVTLFDEIALKNDIDAACAGAIFVASTGRKNRPERECPYCAEMVLTKAKICRFCNNTI